MLSPHCRPCPVVYPGKVHSIFLRPFWIKDKPEGLTVHSNQIAVTELPAAAGFLLTVHLDFTALYPDLRLQTILDQISQFEELTEPDWAGGDDNVLAILFHGIAMPVGW